MSMSTPGGARGLSARWFLKNPLQKTAWALAVALALVLLIATTALLLSVFRNVARFEPVTQHLRYVDALWALESQIEHQIIREMPQTSAISAETITQLQRQIGVLSTLEGGLSSGTPNRLRAFQQRLEQLSSDGNAAGAPLLALLELTIDAELAERRLLLADVDEELQAEERIVVLIAIVIPTLALGLLFSFRQNVIVPVRRIADLLATLGAGDFRQVDETRAPLTVRPVLQNYNRLVSRLAELESERREREVTLEGQVRLATANAMRLHGTLANTEKLAAVGEVAAGIAHELRNPLAGIQVALDNLRAEVVDPDQVARLNLVLGELKRMTALLNNLLERASHAPEQIVAVRLWAAIDEVVQLARLQMPSGVQVEQCVNDDLECRLPEDRFRQVILNLLLNSGQAIGAHGGRIDIEAHSGDRRVEIVISDDGPGFPESVVQDAPRPFHSSRRQGTGLGLAIVRRFAQDLGGALRIENLKPRGARVTLTLPRQHDL